ncbi:MAG: redoxin domain-containing protein [Bacteroidales bacterium]|nr:redoxin domain-containing protein [Bacteroidales bacterium]
MIRALITSCILLILSNLSAQETHQISGSFAGLSNEKIYLMSVSGENRKLVDTTRTDQAGAFSFILKENAPVGMYMAIQGPGRAVELIYNHEDIRFSTTGFNGDDQVQIISSVENLLYYDYLFIKGSNLYKMDLLRPVINEYPKTDPFYSKVLTQYDLLKQQLNDRIETLTSENPHTLASIFIKTDAPVIAPLGLTPEDENKYMKVHYFDGVDFNDTLLIHSSILTSKVVQYMSLFQFNAGNQESLENNLLIAVDTVLNKAAVNQQVYEFLVDFMVKGFEGIGFERGLEHIANSNQLEQFCENTERKAKLANKMEFIRKLALGQKAPDFTVVDLNGDSVNLDKIKSKTTVLVFWASWCPHCDELLPVIKSFYDQTTRNQLEVIAVSVDDSNEKLLKSIHDNGYNWINIAELKGWDGPMIDEYGIAATPTVFVLDKDKIILSKPLNKELLKNELQKRLTK